MSRISGINSNDALMEEDSELDKESEKLSTANKEGENPDGDNPDEDLERGDNMSPDDINSPLQSPIQSPLQSPTPKLENDDDQDGNQQFQQTSMSAANQMADIVGAENITSPPGEQQTNQ